MGIDVTLTAHVYDTRGREVVTQPFTATLYERSGRCVRHQGELTITNTTPHAFTPGYLAVSFGSFPTRARLSNCASRPPKSAEVLVHFPPKPVRIQPHDSMTFKWRRNLVLEVR